MNWTVADVDAISHLCVTAHDQYDGIAMARQPSLWTNDLNSVSRKTVNRSPHRHSSRRWLEAPPRVVHEDIVLQQVTVTVTRTFLMRRLQ